MIVVLLINIFFLCRWFPWHNIKIIIIKRRGATKRIWKIAFLFIDNNRDFEVEWKIIKHIYCYDFFFILFCLLYNGIVIVLDIGKLVLTFCFIRFFLMRCARILMNSQGNIIIMTCGCVQPYSLLERNGIYNYRTVGIFWLLKTAAKWKKLYIEVFGFKSRIQMVD